jgi:hypothetical protein
LLELKKLSSKNDALFALGSENNHFIAENDFGISNSNFRGRRRQAVLFQAVFCFEPKAKSKIKSEKK